MPLLRVISNSGLVTADSKMSLSCEHAVKLIVITAAVMKAARAFVSFLKKFFVFIIVFFLVVIIFV